MKLILVDHDDSFSWNVHHQLHELTHDLSWPLIQRSFDDPNLTSEIEASLQQGGVMVVLSPGPGEPQHKQQSIELYKNYKDRCAFWGICLGHQIIGWCEGFTLGLVQAPVHGTQRDVLWQQDFPVRGARRSLRVGVYNSLRLMENQGVAADFAVVARDDQGEIAAIQRVAPGPLVLGVQFHPESFLSDQSAELWRAMLQHAARSCHHKKS